MKFNSFSAKCLFSILLGLLTAVQSQTINSIPGTWFKNSPGGTGCPALEFDANNRPTVFSLTQVAPPNGTTDFTLYALQQYRQGASSDEWKNDFPIYNLNQRELVTSLCADLDEKGNAFLSWVETKHQYGEPSIALGQRVGTGEFPNLFRVDASKEAFAAFSKLDEQGNPIIAWSEGVLAKEISSGQVTVDYLKQAYYSRNPQREHVYKETITFVRRWNGTAWQDVGTPLKGHNPVIILDKQGEPYVGYVRTAANQSELVVVHWDGQDWEQIGEVISNRLFDEFHPSSLIIDDDGMPIVAVVGLDESGGFDLIIKKWDGSSWKRLGENSSVVESYNALDVSLDYRAGKLVLASIEAKPQTFDFEPPQTLFVKEWNGETWRLLGGSEVSSNAACPMIKLDKQGNPYVAWSQIFSDGHTAHTNIQLSHFVRE